MNPAIRIFSKIFVFSTLFLVFAGSLVTSTGSGLAVPDWPLSYGMFFPPMVGGIFYEHGHRMIATFVGFLTLIFAIWLKYAEKRAWVRRLGFGALLIVISQGILGGLTVIFLLPKPVSISHAILAQTFFIITIILAYSQSKERSWRENQSIVIDRTLVYGAFIVMALIYIQLIIAALMRHTGSGLAIPDFPWMANAWWPNFDQSTLQWINDWRFKNSLEPVSMVQVMIHFAHRLTALIIAIVLFVLAIYIFMKHSDNKKLEHSAVILIFLLVFQITLGAWTIWSKKAPYIASFHVVTGAGMLGISMLLLLRALPVQWSKWKKRSL